MWNADDSKLISAGTDGAVYEWNLSSGKRETECVLKSCNYNCVSISPDGKIIFAVGSDQTLKEIADSSVSLPQPTPLAAARCAGAFRAYRRKCIQKEDSSSLHSTRLFLLLGQLSYYYFLNFLPSSLSD